ncbi:MAG: 4-alpha-glucanotransferase, partial [Clostridia bacterium]|nr:4-alpha-glucanotransferase [Clostridia bacterium]
NHEDYKAFKKAQKGWLADYALYMAVKDTFEGKPISEWPDKDIRARDKKSLTKYKKELKNEIEFWSFIQYLFFKQWNELKAYANSLGIKLIGDMPIYVSGDGSDIWSSPENFLVDDKFIFTHVAGCPPDDFSEDGQFWGNPLYDWSAMKASKYSWWVKRLKFAANLFDCVRIDHFRGFSGFFSIPAGKMPKDGKWKKGPGMDLFKVINRSVPKLEIIAEDLGFIDKDVKKLLSDSGYPGMKILQFAFGSGSDNPYLPHNHIENCVVYTGNHDNDTSCGWFKSISDDVREQARVYCSLNGEEGYVWGLIKAAYSSVAKLAIIPMQDFLDLDSDARMNTPATIGNWTWRVDKNLLNPSLSHKISQISYIYGRELKPEPTK